MAHLKKFHHPAVKHIIAHNNRSGSHRKVSSKSSISNYKQNYSFFANDTADDYMYYLERLNEIYIWDRENLSTERRITAASWIVTLPQELNCSPPQQHIFFSAVFDFVSSRYGLNNIINNAVHYDEDGQPHIHILFIPVTSNEASKSDYRMEVTDEPIKLPSGRYEYKLTYVRDCDGSPVYKHHKLKKAEMYNEKLSARDVLNPIELSFFHSDLSEYLKKRHIKGDVYCGSAFPKAIKIDELKSFTKSTGLTLKEVSDMQKQIEYLRNELKISKEKIQQLEQQITHENTWGIEHDITF